MKLPAVPRATYRFQLNGAFDFDAAVAVVPYLAALGVSHVYASPFLMARPGSAHGYDITDHNRINPEIGGEEGLDRLVAALRAHGLGLILDFVPNHMGVGGADNPWWLDVLEWAQASPFAEFFDIDWTPAEPTLKGKVLLPFLGNHYGTILENGELKLAFDGAAGTFSVWYYEHRFPIRPRDYGRLLRAARDLLDEPVEGLGPLISEFGKLAPSGRSARQLTVLHRQAADLKARLAALVRQTEALRRALDAVVAHYNGRPGDTASFRDLHNLLERQAYRIAYWRVATAEINYRRFFDINDLAGLRMERPELFEVSHALVFHLISEDKIQGIRLDHVDGLYDPADYCRRLQDRAAYLTMQADQGQPASEADAPPGSAGAASAPERAHPFYIVVEKILARHEHLRADWPVEGTTGYEFANLVNGLFVNANAESLFDQIYRRFIGRDPDFEAVALASKRLMVTSNLASEVNVLASDLHAIARQSWSTRDFSLPGLTQALTEVIAHFPVYRTYITAAGIAEDDRRDLDWAVAQARKTAPTTEGTVFDFLRQVLSTDLRRQRRRGYRSRDILSAALKFQQLTGPAMAKSIEDTAFYRYYRLVSLNEVGGEPARFGVSPSAFHHLAGHRLRHHPHSLLATATHDHKRGEDVRVRIDALTEVGAEWRRRVRRWSTLNARKKREIDGVAGPGRNDEYMIYQTLVGTWPLEIQSPDDPALGDYADRLCGYVVKAAREAKVHSSWSHPNEAYEAAVVQFVRDILDSRRASAFLADFLSFQGRVALIGAVNGLSQLLLKLTVPGVPDLYQGTELWDLSLVDPDNRRPVDYDRRRNMIGRSADAAPGDLLADWRGGWVKLFTVARTLAVRRAIPHVFWDGDYEPLDVTGSHADRIIAFWRCQGSHHVVVVVPRLVAPLLGDAAEPLPPATAWGGTTLVRPDDEDWPGALTDAFTGATWQASASGWRVGDLLSRYPVALLTTASA